MKTYIPKVDEIQQKWYTVDVGGKVLGRAATQIAMVLRGKDKPQFTPHLDVGDYVIVLNAREVVFTGRKENAKTYFRYSGFPGGAKFESVRRRRQRKPEDIVRDAVWGMLPKNRLGRHLLKKLHVYSGPAHPHMAQQPEVMALP
jgi:large subunit ribosomal protein L13